MKDVRIRIFYSQKELRGYDWHCIPHNYSNLGSWIPTIMTDSGYFLRRKINIKNKPTAEISK